MLGRSMCHERPSRGFPGDSYDIDEDLSEYSNGNQCIIVIPVWYITFDKTIDLSRKETTSDNTLMTK